MIKCSIENTSFLSVKLVLVPGIVMTQSVPTGRKTSRASTSKITDSQWERHKTLLTRLYISQNLTVGEIKILMLNEHDFSAK